MGNRHYSISPAEVLRYLDGVAYPAPRGTLLNHARRVDAPPSAMRLLERMPDRTYQNPADVGEAIGSVE